MNDALKAKKLSSEHFICEFCYSLTSSEDKAADYWQFSATILSGERWRMRTQVIVGLCLCLSLVEAHGDEHSPRFKRSIYEVHFKTLTFLNISKLISSPAEINSPFPTRTRTSGFRMEKMSSNCLSRRHRTLILQRLILVNCTSKWDLMYAFS